MSSFKLVRSYWKHNYNRGEILKKLRENFVLIPIDWSWIVKDVYEEKKSLAAQNIESTLIEYRFNVRMLIQCVFYIDSTLYATGGASVKTRKPNKLIFMRVTFDRALRDFQEQLPGGFSTLLLSSVSFCFQTPIPYQISFDTAKISRNNRFIAFKTGAVIGHIPNAPLSTHIHPE